MLQSGHAERNGNPNTQISQVTAVHSLAGKGGPEFLAWAEAGRAAGVHLMLSLHPVGPRCECFSGSRYCKTFGAGGKPLQNIQRCSSISQSTQDRQHMGQMFRNPCGICTIHKINCSFVFVAGRLPERTLTKAYTLKFKTRDCV